VIPQYVLQRDERYFPSGDEFIPERWLASSKKEELVKHEEAFFPFQLGRYGCVGKQLALMQLRAVIARIAYDFDMEFAEGEDGVAFDGKSMDTFTFTLGDLMVVFKERNRG
jgi:cytochrome P450